MASTAYSCERYPQLSLGGKQGREVKFRLGKFVATRPWERELIEENEWYGVFIFPMDPREDNPLPSSPNAVHTRADRPPDVHVPPKGGDQTHIEDAKRAALGLPPRGAEQPEAKPKAEEPGEEAAVLISKTAAEILEAAGVSVEDAAKDLGLEEGDRLTVKMAQDYVDG